MASVARVDASVGTARLGSVTIETGRPESTTFNEDDPFFSTAALVGPRFDHEVPVMEVTSCSEPFACETCGNILPYLARSRAAAALMKRL